MPIYAGSFEITHKDCPFLPLSRQIEEDIPLSVVSSTDYATQQVHRVRFALKRPLPRTGVKSLMGSPNVAKITVWADGITKVEMECKEKLLDAVMPITSLTFGDIRDYVATMETEKIRIISPSSPDISGKERLLEMEEKLKEIGDAELTGFHQFAAEDLDTRISKILDEQYAETWLLPADVELLNTAYRMGYFEIPRRCELKDIAERTEVSVTTLHGKLRLINRVLAERFLEKSKQPLPP